MRQIKNITELRKTLCETLLGLRTGKVVPAIATEVNNAAGKIISTAKLEMEYSRARKEDPSIPFMEG